ncbi:hypothetical protein [Bhargavaea massiliensis]|uniref:hypothetical protein n=1 Tax=Bhargavaea massiliensis TaxID=2697500 RepID=UPI001BCFC14A|nr:hypothetical protein [Bhargavaea massiliensis]
MKKRVLQIISAIFAAHFAFRGFYKLLAYDNGEYSDKAVNAYVGGDAYNYIINGTHATAYFTLAGAFLITTVLLEVVYLLRNMREERSVVKDMELDNTIEQPLGEKEGSLPLSKRGLTKYQAEVLIDTKGRTIKRLTESLNSTIEDDQLVEVQTQIENLKKEQLELQQYIGTLKK